MKYSFHPEAKSEFFEAINYFTLPDSITRISSLKTYKLSAV